MKDVFSLVFCFGSIEIGIARFFAAVVCFCPGKQFFHISLDESG